MSAPIFIVSCERSGSTLLRLLIDTHPEICSPGELALGRVCEALLHVVVTAPSGSLSNILDEPERCRAELAEVRRIVSTWMDSYALSVGKRVWCDKTPFNVNFLDLIGDVFPDARFVCLYRNCMDVLHSYLEATKTGFYVEPIYYSRNIPRQPFSRTGENSVGVFVDSWVDKNSKIMAFERENASRCFRVKYESLVFQPEDTMKGLFAFLEVDWDAALLEIAFAKRHSLGYGDGRAIFSKDIHTNSVGLGSRLSLSLLPRGSVEKINPVLKSLQYPEIGPDWGLGPSPYTVANESGHKLDGADTNRGVRELFTEHAERQLKGRMNELGGPNQYYKLSAPDIGTTWHIDVRTDSVRVSTEPNGRESADCTILVSSSDLMDLVTGKLNPFAAFEQGSVRVLGSVGVAMLLGQALFGG